MTGYGQAHQDVLHNNTQGSAIPGGADASAASATPSSNPLPPEPSCLLSLPDSLLADLLAWQQPAHVPLRQSCKALRRLLDERVQTLTVSYATGSDPQPGASSLALHMPRLRTLRCLPLAHGAQNLQQAALEALLAKGWPQMQCLDLSDARAPGCTLQLLTPHAAAALPRLCPNLTALSFQMLSDEEEGAEEVVRVLQGLPHLRRLQGRILVSTRAFAAALVQLRGLQALHEVTMEAYEGEVALLDVLCDQGLSQLTHLRLRLEGAVHVEYSMEALSRLESLEWLEVKCGDCRNIPVLPSLLRALGALSRLRRLSLHGICAWHRLRDHSTLRNVRVLYASAEALHSFNPPWILEALGGLVDYYGFGSGARALPLLQRLACIEVKRWVLPKLAALAPQLRRLHLVGLANGGGSCTTLLGLTNLVQLHLHRVWLGTGDVGAVQQLAGSLTSLALTDSYANEAAALARLASVLPLRSLLLRSVNVAFSMNELSAVDDSLLPQLNQGLTRLALDVEGLTDQGLLQIAGLCELRALGLWLPSAHASVAQDGRGVQRGGVTAGGVAALLHAPPPRLARLKVGLFPSRWEGEGDTWRGLRGVAAGVVVECGIRSDRDLQEEELEALLGG